MDEQVYGPAVAQGQVLAITGWRLGRRLSLADEEYLEQKRRSHLSASLKAS